MKRTVRVMVILPGTRGKGEIATIPNTLKSFQEVVGGYIETVRIHDRITAVVNRDGLRLGLASNVLGLVGPILITRADIFSGEFVDLQNKDIAFMQNLLNRRNQDEPR